tara:strand:- start:1374 stop:1601 length:228 start_codon:yes stop_codon:yes gene_type:complete
MNKPKHATHVKLQTVYEGTNRVAIEDIKNMDCFRGSPGIITYLRQLRGNNWEELGSFEFDGKWPLTEKDNETTTK